MFCKKIKRLQPKPKRRKHKMANVLEMVADIVAAHARTTPMTTDELLAELKTLYKELHALEKGISSEAVSSEEEPAPTLTIKQAFRTNEVICMICGKGGMKILTRHLNQAHNGLKPSHYRKQFNIPKSQKLMSKAYEAKRKEIASGMNLGANLEKARIKRQENIADKKAKVPAVKVKAPVPAVRKKAAVPVKAGKK
jgi:predicted transcriptional regulator